MDLAYLETLLLGYDHAADAAELLKSACRVYGACGLLPAQTRKKARGC